MPTHKGVTATIGGLPQIARNVHTLAQQFPKWLADANQTTAREVQSEAQRNVRQIDAYDTHELHDSFRIVKARNGLSAIVANVAPHAPFIEFGTAPHFPPVDAIRAWCVRKGIDPGAAYPIARAIAERGTPERPFMRPAYESQKRPHIERVRSLVWLGMRGFLGPAKKGRK